MSTQVKIPPLPRTSAQKLPENGFRYTTSLEQACVSKQDLVPPKTVCQTLLMAPFNQFEVTMSAFSGIKLDFSFHFHYRFYEVESTPTSAPVLSAGTRYKKSHMFNVTCKLQKLLQKGQEYCSAIHRALPQMCPISALISVKQHHSCLNADTKCFTGDHIYCSATNIFVKLAHIIQRNSKRRKKTNKKN